MYKYTNSGGGGAARPGPALRHRLVMYISCIYLYIYFLSAGPPYRAEGHQAAEDGHFSFQQSGFLNIPITCSSFPQFVIAGLL